MPFRLTARSRSSRLADRLLDGHLRLRDDHRERNELAVGAANANETEVLGARSLGRKEAHPDVDPTPVVRVLSERIAADERGDGAAEIGDRDPEIRRATAVRHDLELAAADRVVGGDVRREAARLQLLDHHVGGGDERVPVGAADREVDRRAARRPEALLGRILYRARMPAMP